MADPQLLAQALMVPKQPLPQSFYNPEETNPLVKALMKEPSIPNPSDPPHWARQAVVDAVRPVLDAGQWLGGVMGGNVQPTMGDAVTNLGGAALAGVMPPGARAAGAVERVAEPMAQMAEHGLFDLTKPGIRAFHGSPYDFNAFDASKIGSGEGAQAYGHGLYFAEHEPVARSYRDVLTTVPNTGIFNDMIGRLDSHGLTPAEKAFATDAINTKMTTFPNDSYATILDYLKENSTLQHPENFDKVKQALENVGKGHMYEVNINADPQHFLDWDKPLSEHPDSVRKAMFGTDFFGNLKSPGGKPFKNSDGAWTAVDPRSGGYISGYESKEAAVRGAQDIFYREALKDPEVTARMSKAGIPGIKYLDQGSREKGEGTNNYVVFDPEMVKIIKKYGIAGLGTYLGQRGLNSPDSLAKGLSQ